MSRDFGGGRRGGGFPVAVAAVVVGVLLAGGAWLWSQQRWVAQAKHWTIQGPPCRQLSAGEFQAASAGGPMMIDSFDDMDFGRAYGHVSCADIHDDGGRGWGQHAVCQFSSPTRVVVRIGRQQTYFAATPGQPVAVSVQHGRAECVLGGDEWGAAAAN